MGSVGRGFEAELSRVALSAPTSSRRIGGLYDCGYVESCRGAQCSKGDEAVGWSCYCKDQDGLKHRWVGQSRKVECTVGVTGAVRKVVCFVLQVGEFICNLGLIAPVSS